MEEENEIQTPETVQFQTPLRVRKARIAGAPRPVLFEVLRQFRDRFEVRIPSYRGGSVILVPRSNRQNARQAIQAYLTTDGGDK